MDKIVEEAAIQSAQMHFKAFQEFMKMTGGQVGLSLQLASSWTAGMIKAATNNETEESGKLWNIMEHNKRRIWNCKMIGGKLYGIITGIKNGRGWLNQKK